MADSVDVAVAGASGALGGAICARLAERGLTVRALTRADLTDPAALDGARCVLSTVSSFPRDREPGAIERVDRDVNVSLVDAAVRAGAERFVFVSNRPIDADFPLQRAKRAVEQHVLAAPLEGVVLRPAKFMEIWFTPLCGFDVSARRATIFGDGTRGVSWVSRDDVAELAAELVADAQRPEPIVDLGGPEALSQREVVALYEQVTGEAWALDSIPAEELERRVREPEGEVQQSLAALMLDVHRGAPIDNSNTLARYPLRLTSVREFAQRG